MVILLKLKGSLLYMDTILQKQIIGIVFDE
jgi:hypothetical protein